MKGWRATPAYGRWLRHLAVSLWLVAVVCLQPVQAAETTTYVLTDDQGTVVMLTDTHGNPVERFDYRPYGQQSGPVNAGPGYTGHVNDPEAGLVYMQQRYYDPSIGRFLSVDPIRPKAGNKFTINRYAYVNDNPVMFVDLTGMACGGNGEVSSAVQRLRDKSDRCDSGGNSSSRVATVVAFDGAGGADGSDNQRFHQLATRLGAQMYDGKAGFGRGQAKDALAAILKFMAKNPNGKVYVIGYSAGGDDSIWLANKLAEQNIKVAGMVTFDPHVKWRAGYTSYRLAGNVASALNFFQRNPHDVLYNTFRGSPVNGAINIDLTGDPDAVHSTIVTESIIRYGSDILETMGQ